MKSESSVLVHSKYEACSPYASRLGLGVVVFWTYLFMLPFDSWDTMSLYIGFIHVSMSDLLLVATFYVVLMENLITRAMMPRKFMSVFVLFALAAISSLVNFFYHSGAHISFDIKLTLNLIEFMVIFYVVSYVIKNQYLLRKTVLVFFCISFIVTILMILKSLGIDIPGDERIIIYRFGVFRIGVLAIFSEYLPFTITVLGSLPLLLFNYVTNNKFLKYTFILCFLISSVIANSRSLMLALITEFWVYFLLMARGNKRDVLRTSIYSFVFLSMSFLLVVYHNEIYRFLLNIRPVSAMSRYQAYILSLKLYFSDIKYVLFGLGKGVFMEKNYFETGNELVLHNFILDILLSKGIFVLLFVLLILAIILKALMKIFNEAGDKTIKTIKKKSAAVFIVSFAGIFVEAMFEPVTNSIIFWTYIALMFSFVNIYQEKDSAIET